MTLVEETAADQAEFAATDHLLSLLAPIGRAALRPSSQPRYRRFLDALGVAVYTADREGRITYFNHAATELWGRTPALGELWCGSWQLFWTDGRPMRHEECPMALALTEERVVRGYEAIAERPDGSRIAFVPYPTPLYDDDSQMIGAVNVLVDVTERRRAEDALRDAAEALAASSAVKDEFLGLVSHELRTPVTTIFGNASLLRDRGDRVGEADRHQMVADIAADAERLLGTVENLLLLTRLGTEATIDSEPQLLDRAVQKAVSSYRGRHPERRIVLHQRARHLIVDADAAYVQTVLENLLSNADKYSPSGSMINVTIDAHRGFGRIFVRDRGIGLDDADLMKLFSPFYRGNKARSMGNGVGIGLAVCRRLVELLGGQLCASPRRGGGSEFQFTLPLAAAAEPNRLASEGDDRP